MALAGVVAMGSSSPAATAVAVTTAVLRGRGGTVSRGVRRGRADKGGVVPSPRTPPPPRPTNDGRATLPHGLASHRPTVSATRPPASQIDATTTATGVTHAHRSVESGGTTATVFGFRLFTSVDYCCRCCCRCCCYRRCCSGRCRPFS